MQETNPYEKLGPEPLRSDRGVLRQSRRGAAVCLPGTFEDYNRNVQPSGEGAGREPRNEAFTS